MVVGNLISADAFSHMAMPSRTRLAILIYLFLVLCLIFLLVVFLPKGRVFLRIFFSSFQVLMFLIVLVGTRGQFRTSILVAFFMLT